jgi:hypothetical protein
MGFLLAGVCFAAALACSAGGLRSLLPRGVTLVDACARFGCGSLGNTFLPIRGGDVIRLTLFSRIVPGGMLAAAGAVAAFSVARWVTLVPLGIGAAVSSLPPEAFAAPAVALVVAVLVAKRSGRRGGYGGALVFATGSLLARVTGVTLVVGSLSAALLVVPALELAGTVSFLPANLGVADAAAAVALHAHGLPMGHAISVAVVLHVVETAASVVFGAAGAALLLSRGDAVKRLFQSGFRRRNPLLPALQGEQ